MNVYAAIRARLDYGLLRAWTGPGTLTLDEPFAPDGTEPGASAAEYAPGAGMLTGADGRLAFSGLAFSGPNVTGRLVDVFSVGEDDAGKRRLLPFVRRGLLDNLTLTAGVYTVTVAPRTYPAVGEQWSHEEQKRRHQGDTYFSQMKALAKGLEGIHFPDVPNFRADGDYDTLTISKRRGGGGTGTGVGQGGGEDGERGVIDLGGGVLQLRAPGVAQVGGTGSARRIAAARFIGRPGT